MVTLVATICTSFQQETIVDIQLLQGNMRGYSNTFGELVDIQVLLSQTYYSYSQEQEINTLTQVTYKSWVKIYFWF